MSTPAVPSVTALETLLAQLAADEALFTKIYGQVKSIQGNWLKIFTVISTLVEEVPQVISAIQKTIADVKAIL